MAAPLVLHIIRNQDVALTECGELMASSVPDLAATTPQPVLGGGLAVWDDAPLPADAWTCPACWRAYLS